jgi:hypothetical protein
MQCLETVGYTIITGLIVAGAIVSTGLIGISGSRPSSTPS